MSDRVTRADTAEPGYKIVDLNYVNLYYEISRKRSLFTKRYLVPQKTWMRTARLTSGGWEQRG